MPILHFEAHGFCIDILFYDFHMDYIEILWYKRYMPMAHPKWNPNQPLLIGSMVWQCY